MKKFVARAALLLVVALLILVLLSWLLTATMTDGVRSLLSAEGIRFFFGSFTDMMLHPLLVWLLLLMMAYGSFRGSGLSTAFRRSDSHRPVVALRITALLLFAMAGVIVLLVALPHAVLLSATGRLWPSPFSRALVPVIAFAIVILSAVYGLLTRRFLSLADILQAMTQGIAKLAPLLLLYILGMQLYGAACFVFPYMETI
ncbi:MAG: AbgT family transporter [Prevotella sp.]|nr:AbgT family transporter [Prevotella sp.]